MTNGEFAAADEVFRKACSLSLLSPTSRQASKWRNGKGKALTIKARAIFEVEKEKREKAAAATKR